MGGRAGSGVFGSRGKLHHSRRSRVTTTGGGIINGDVGASPISGSAIHLTDAQVNGTIYAVDAAGPAGSVINSELLLAAKGDLKTAFNDAAGRSPIPSGPFLNPGAGNLGGLNLAPGLYKFTGTALITGSDLTLTGGPDDVWIFQIAADLQVGSTVQVILAGGAQARNIFWQVGTSAVVGTFAVFKGTILADQAITMNTSSAMDGKALAMIAGVTFNGDVGGNQTTLEPPVFTSISRASNGTVTTDGSDDAVLSADPANQHDPAARKLEDNRLGHAGFQPVELRSQRHAGHRSQALLSGVPHALMTSARHSRPNKMSVMESKADIVKKSEPGDFTKSSFVLVCPL